MTTFLLVTSIEALLAISLYLPLAGGALSVMPIAVVEVSSYIAAFLIAHGWSVLEAGVIAFAGSLAFGALGALVFVRLTGFGAALGSFAVVQILLVAFDNFGPTGGAQGLYNVPLYASVAIATVSVLVAGVLLLCALEGTRYGLRVRAVHDDPLTAECVGLSVTRVRFWLSTGGAAFAAFAGILQTGYLGYVIPSEFGLVEVNAIMLAVILGGTTSVIGPIVGSIVYELVLQWTGALGGYHVAFISGLVLLVLVIKPGGLISVRPDRLWQRLAPTRLTAAPVSPVPIPGSPAVSNPERGRPRAADALVIEGVSKSYGKVAVLITVDLTLRPGQILSVIGPNGAGKTTLLNVASGVVRPDQGTVTCNGTGLTGKPPHVFVRHGVCRTFQNLRFFRQLNVVENLAVGMGWPQVAETLRRFELDDKGKRDPNSMAYGERRKLEIARALNLGGRYILLDEPVAGMNDNEKDYVAELILAARNDGLGILVIEHDLAFVQRVSDTVMTLIAGTVVTTGDFDTAIANPALLEAYFGKSDEGLGAGMEDGYSGMSSDGLALPGASAPQAVSEWPEPHREAIGGVTPLPQSNIQGKDMK